MAFGGTSGTALSVLRLGRVRPPTAPQTRSPAVISSRDTAASATRLSYGEDSGQREDQDRLAHAPRPPGSTMNRKPAVHARAKAPVDIAGSEAA